MQKALILISLTFFIASIFNCSKNTETITGSNTPDTTDHGGPVVYKPNIYIYPS